MDRGLNYKELQELLQNIERYHSWKNMYENNYIKSDNKFKIIKYVHFNMDTRDCMIWSVTFSQIINDNEREITFRTEIGYNLKEKIYSWLKEIK